MGAELMRERKEGEMVSSNNSNIPTFLVFPSLCGHDHKGHQHHDEGGKQATHSEKHTESSAVAEQNCSFQ